MANVENPYETNLSNNLVVTSYVDESTAKSDYILRAYSSSLDLGYYPEDYSIEANFKVRPEFYKDNPAEQTVGITYRNLYEDEALGLTDIKSPLDTDLTVGNGTNSISFEILNAKDRSVLTAKDFTINEIGTFYCILKVPNLNTKEGWNQFVDMSAFTEDIETSSTTKTDDLAQLSLILTILYSRSNLGDIKNIGLYDSIYLPAIFSKEKLNLSTNKPEGWTNTQIHYHYFTALDLYVYFDLQNAYNIIPTFNSTSIFEFFNNLPTDIFDNEENADANLNLLINGFNKYLESLKNLEKYTDANTDIILNNVFNIREELNTENTSYRKEAISENETTSASIIGYDNTLDTLHFYFNTDVTIGRICQLTHPDLKAPLNIVVENYYCFADNSMVSTDKGLVAMKDLTLDHNVKCWDFDNGCITYAKPLFIQTHGKVSRSFEAVFDDGTICKYSKPHRCYCVDTRLFESLSYARNIGKSFYFEDGSIKKLVEWRVVDEPTTVYTMLTDHYMTSFVDGILAGSNMVMIYFIDKDMKYYKKPERKGNRKNNFGIPDKIFRGLRLYESPIPKGIIMRWLKREFISF